jgi:ADP-dependent phosphofructokinase/glucokinase
LLLPEYKKRTDIIVEALENKRPKIHLEFGLGCEKSMTYAMEKFTEYAACDSWGLNEKECKIYLKASSENKKDLIESALKAVKEYNLKRICIHSSRFAFSISKYNIKKEIEALATACFVAGLKTFDKKSLRLQKSPPIKKKLDNCNFCLVPSLYNPSPKKLTGIGDVFASIQAVKILS